MNWHRTLAVGLTLAVILGANVAGALSASAAGASVVRGSTYRTRIFPDDFFTVADAQQLTGKRVSLRQGIDYPACDATNYSLCDAYAMLNTLDGFDLEPRVTIPFSGPIDMNSVNSSDVFVQGPGGRTGLVQLVWDPASNSLSGITNGFLTENSAYNIVVSAAVRDTSGHPVNACGGACVVPFTTRTASAELDQIRQALDSGAAYPNAGIGSRKLNFVQNSTTDAFLAASVVPSIADPLNGIQRLDQTTTNPANLTASAVPNLINPATVSYYAFGSFLSPRYQYASANANADDPNGNTDGFIPAIPTSQTPQPFGADRLGAVLVLPAGVPPGGCWPVAIYGPGFTRSKYDTFVSADNNAAMGIATIATDPAGHAFGPNSQVTVTHAGVATTFQGYGRGRDLNGDGIIGDGLDDGVRPTDHKQTDGTFLPSRRPLDGLRSGLTQTVVDNMALERSIEAGVDIPGVGNDLLCHNGISYYGISFGGIYGTMLMGTDTHFQRGLLNVPGGPIADIARLSSFRGDLQNTLMHGKPNLLNGGPGNNGFTESIPLRGDPPVTSPYPGAIPIQELFGAVNWYDRAGSPETFAPLLRMRPLAGEPQKQLVFQTAYSDGTVPNPTAGTLYRAGQLFDLVTYYRHDRVPVLYANDPHGWLADPTLGPARSFGQLQEATFLKTGSVINPNPLLFEVPIADIGNLDCLHYPDPQTGQPETRTFHPTGGDCPLLPQDANGGFEAAVSIPGVISAGQLLLASGGGLPNTDALGTPVGVGFVLLALVLSGFVLRGAGVTRLRR